MEIQPKNEVQNRGQFLRDLGISSAALMAFYCMGTLSACSSSNDPTPATTTGGTNTGGTGSTTTGITGNADPSKGTVDFTLDLTDASYKTLKTEGGFVYVNNLIVAQAKGGSFVALSKICTHEGTTIEYKLDESDFYCSNHGSRFNNDGSVKNGPAAKSLAVYKTTLSSDSNKLQVTA